MDLKMVQTLFSIYCQTSIGYKKSLNTWPWGMSLKDILDSRPIYKPLSIGTVLASYQNTFGKFLAEMHLFLNKD